MKIKQADIIAALAGTYSLVNNTVTRGGVIEPPSAGWGNNPVGLLTYTSYGYMAANQAATEPAWRPQGLTFPPRPTDSDADWNLVGRHAMAYAGPFSINMTAGSTKTKGQVLHGPLTVASVPSMVGGVQKREYLVKEVRGQTYLYVTVSGTAAGVPFVSEILWRRVVKG